MALIKIVARTNNPWENLKILRELKKKYKATYTCGLINTDTGAFYGVSDSKKIYCIRREYYPRKTSSFKVEEYFKRSNRVTFKGDVVFFSTAECSEGGSMYQGFGRIGKGIYIDDVKHHTFDYAIVKTDEGTQLVRKCHMHKNKDILNKIMADRYKRELKNKENEIEYLKEEYKTFVKQLKGLK